MYTEEGNIVAEEYKKKEEVLCKEERRRSGKFQEAISVFQKSNNLEPYLHVPGPQTVPGGLSTKSGSGTSGTSSSSRSHIRGRSSISQEGFRGQGGGTGSLQEDLNSTSSRGNNITSLCGTALSKRAADHSQLSGIILTAREVKTTAGVAPERLLANEKQEISLICETVMGLDERNHQHSSPSQGTTEDL